jgi:hypothetical protein
MTAPTGRAIGRFAAAALAALAAATWSSSGAEAQGVRITGTTTARYLDLRPFVDDSVSVDSTEIVETGSSLRTATSRGGIAVRCEPGDLFCRYKRSADDPVSTVPLIQDIEATAWGFGEGISAYAHLRGRAAMGEADDLWPQADDEFDALAAYVEVDRRLVRARLGRQFKASGLGWYNYDGAEVRVRARRDVTVEVFGGRSLLRGINAPHTASVIGAVEDFPPDDDAWLIGAEVRVRPSARWSAGVLYQREIMQDRSGLFSERVTADGTVRLGRWGTVDGEVETDLATGDWNQVRLRATVPVRRRLALTLEGRHYDPFFDLWTIWSAFSPVAYDEVNAGAILGAGADRYTLAVRGGWRRYRETDEGVATVDMRRDGWRVSADGTVRLTPDWFGYGGYRTDVGFGAARTDGDLGVRWEPGTRGYVGAHVTAFQSVYELRVGTGRVIGGGLDAGFRITPEIRVLGDVATYRHTFEDRAPQTNWSQVRGTLRLEWTIGSDPGMRGSVR